MSFVYETIIMFILGYFILVLPIAKKITDETSRKNTKKMAMITTIIISILFASVEGELPIVSGLILIAVVRAI